MFAKDALRFYNLGMDIHLICFTQPKGFPYFSFGGRESGRVFYFLYGCLSILAKEISHASKNQCNRQPTKASQCYTQGSGRGI